MFLFDLTTVPTAGSDLNRFLHVKSVFLGDASIFLTIIVSFLVTVLAGKIRSSSLFSVSMLRLAVPLVSTTSFIL